MKIRHLSYIFFCIILLSSHKGFAQASAYHGGKGDGFAMGELNGVMVSIQSNRQQDLSLIVYPNPIKQGGILYCRLPIGGQWNISVTDLIGRPVYSRFYEGPASDIALDLKASPGSYILCVMYGDFKVNSLITVQ